MTGGSSGGPWFSGFSNLRAGTGTLTSVNSYKYNADSNAGCTARTWGRWRRSFYATALRRS